MRVSNVCDREQNMGSVFNYGNQKLLELFTNVTHSLKQKKQEIHKLEHKEQKKN